VIAPSSSKEQRNFTRRIKEARVGDAAAQYDVALMYANGVGVAKNVEQALEWTQSAARKGHPAAQYLLGTAYLGGLGTQRDPVQAMSWLLRAAESGNDKAPWKLARVLGTEAQSLAQDLMAVAAVRGVAEAQCALAAQSSSDSATPIATTSAGKPKHGGALEWYRKAAQQGLASAQFALAGLLELDPDQALPDELAQDWYRAAANQGHPAAHLALVRQDAAGQGRDADKKGAARKPASRERRLPDDRWDRYATKGDAEDQFNLGLMYTDGYGVEKSAKQAKLWLQRAAQTGHVAAQAALANLLLPNAPAEAVKWLRLAATQGHAQALTSLGECFEQGRGVQASATEALGWYAQAAAQGDVLALERTAALLQSQSNSLPQEFITRAAEGGVASAQHQEGQRFADETNPHQDWRKAVAWYRRAAEQGHADAQCALADCLAGGLGARKDAAQALVWYERAVLQDHPRAQWSLGEILAQGQPGGVPEPRRAALLCKRAAQGGFAPAQSTLAAMFAKAGKYDKAAHWWTLAAEQSDPEALFNLAHAYRVGWVPATSDHQVFDLLLRAAQTGLAQAQARLGLAYATGEGAALDPIEAAKWFVLAAQRGDTAARSNQLRSEQTLSPAQWAEALRRAASWASA
jgi:TPR repeat protein